MVTELSRRYAPVYKMHMLWASTSHYIIAVSVYWWGFPELPSACSPRGNMGFRICLFNLRTETQIIVSKFSLALFLNCQAKRMEEGKYVRGKWLKVIFYLYLLTWPRNLPKERCERLSLSLALWITQWQFNLQRNWGPPGAYCQMCFGVFGGASSWFYCFSKRFCMSAECSILYCGGSLVLSGWCRCFKLISQCANHFPKLGH